MNESLHQGSLDNRSSIRRRLVGAILVTSLAALAVVTGAFVTVELVRIRRDMPKDLGIMADVIGQNSSVAILFEDESPAREALAALAVEPHIQAAAVYTADGREFARFLAAPEFGGSIPDRAGGPGYDFQTDHLDVVREIQVDGETIGTIFVRSDTRKWTERVAQYGLIVAIVVGLTAALAMFAAARLRSSIVDPLSQVVGGADSLAGGDLSVEVNVRNDDEIGRLADAFNAMTGSLRDLVSRVKDDTGRVNEVARELEAASRSMFESVGRQERAIGESESSVARMTESIDQVNSSAESLSDTANEASASVAQMDASIGEIAANMDHLSTVIDQSASSVTQLSAAIGEINGNTSTLGDATEETLRSLREMLGSVGNSAEQARQSHELAQSSERDAERGLQAVSQTVDGMNAVRDAMGGIEDVISRLSQKSTSIGEVVQVIEDVVSQTNLLALNAAIIAAQAGEHGRAFAVVASEVQQLAETTAGSTREIESIIQSVQGDVSAAVEAVTGGMKRVEEGVGVAGEAGEVLRSLRESASRVSDMVARIVEASEHQGADITRLDGAMVRVKDIVQQISASTGEQANASGELTRGVEQVRSLGNDVMRATREQRKQSRVITSTVNEVAKRVSEVAEATAEQQQGGERITRALQVFREVIEQGSAHATDIGRTVETLTSRSEALEGEIGRFRL